MKFLADMPISPRTVEQLREKGYDAVHLFSLGMQKAKDDEVVEFGRQENRITINDGPRFWGDIGTFKGTMSRNYHISCPPSYTNENKFSFV